MNFHDVEATMKTMVNEAIVHNVPVLTGGVGFDNVFNFYKNQYVGKMPDDTKITRISIISHSPIIFRVTYEHLDNYLMAISL